MSWETDRAKLKKIYLQAGITTCEVRLPGCTNGFGLTFAHRYKRRDSRCANTFSGTVLACLQCHLKLEFDRKLTEKVFNRLRPDE